MGKSDSIVKKFYDQCNIQPSGTTALLGYTNNNWYNGDLYDLSLGNWDINSDWHLNNKYDTIICTRTAYFAKNPTIFIYKCINHLNNNGTIYVDWGLGDHFREVPYRVGFIKDGRQTSCYSPTNLVWSTVWSDCLENDKAVNTFKEWIKPLGYNGPLYHTIKYEVPSILNIDSLKLKCHIDTLCIWRESPQLYILLRITNG